MPAYGHVFCMHIFPHISPLGICTFVLYSEMCVLWISLPLVKSIISLKFFTHCFSNSQVKSISLFLSKKKKKANLRAKTLVQWLRCLPCTLPTQVHSLANSIVP